MWGLVHLMEGLRYFRLSSRRKRKGHARYGGRPKDICEHIVTDCYNGIYFRNSVGHYREFWARDFGMSTKSLIKLGLKDEVFSTLKYALDKYAKKRRVTSTITPRGKCYDFPPVRSVDSLAWLLRSLRIAKAKDLVKEHEAFLKREVAKCMKGVWSRDTQLIRPNVRISAMRDYSRRSSSCYDNCMLAMLAEDAKYFRVSPKEWSGINWQKLINKTFWTGRYFKTDMTDLRAMTSDSNLAPFMAGLADNDKLRLVIKAIRARELDVAFPLKYVSPVCKEPMSRMEFFVPRWERECLWTNIALLYIHLVKKVDRALANDYTRQFAEILQRDGTLFEAYTPYGVPYQSWCYMADEGMLWVANLATLL